MRSVQIVGRTQQQGELPRFRNSGIVEISDAMEKAGDTCGQPLR